MPSNVASTANKNHYSVDDIVRPTPCSLLISYGITNLRTKQVGTGLAIPGREMHRAKIPDDYYRVEVLTVMQGHEDDELDIPRPDDIEKLGQAIKNFILWPRRDIRLSKPPQSSEALPLTQEPPPSTGPQFVPNPASPPTEHFYNPPPSPPTEHPRIPPPPP